MQCPITKCDKSVPADKVMCGRHWKTVPRDTQRAVYRTWNARLKRGDDLAIAEHQEAKDTAIAEAQYAEQRRVGAGA